MPKILITGASGFVGSFLVKEAIQRNLNTYAGIRRTSSKERLTSNKIQFTILDFENESEVRTVLANEKFDYVIHNAGITRAAKASQYFRVNSEYAKTLATISMETNPDLKKFVYISSLEAYGSADQTEEGVISERTIPQPRTTYGHSKLRGENMLKQIADLPLIIFRPTGVFGPAEKDFFSIFRSIKKYRLAPVVGSDKIKYSFVYVKDLVRVILDATLSEVRQKGYFVSDGKIYNIREFTGAIASSFQVNPLHLTVPYFVVDILSSFTNIYDKIRGTKSLINPEQVQKMKAKSWDCDISPLVKDFNYTPEYTLQRAVEETSRWYEDQGWL